MFEVELINIRKTFKEVVAVDNFSLQVKHGELLSLLGPSGCGKTTTLRIIAGLEEPTEGIVKIKGEGVNKVPPEKRDTAMVFQTWALFPHKTVFENVAFGLKMRNFPRKQIEEKVQKFLRMVGLEGYGNRYPKQLSGGQRQRVALARCLIIEPAVLLLDEPLSALDLKLRQQMRFEIKRLQKKLNITTIYVTHDQTEALVMSDRIVIMNEGRIEQIGSPFEIYNYPKTKFVADFIGETNFLDGIVVTEDVELVEVELWQGVKIYVRKKENMPFQKKEVCIAIRPEDIFLSKEKTLSAKNILEGKVIDITFLGATIRFHVDINGKIVMADKIVSALENMKFQSGDKVFVRIEPENCVIFPRE